MTFRGIALSLGLLACCSCVPWTVRPIDSSAEAKEQKPVTAAAYVDSIWSARLLPAIEASAVELRQAQASASAHRIVRGSGRVLSVDTKTQSGVVVVDVPPLDGKGDVLIQIGPVVRGTSLRDAAGFIEFGQFANQIQFAEVANELNSRVLREVVPKARAAATPKAAITFVGTYTAEAGELPRIVPVKIERAAEPLP